MIYKHNYEGSVINMLPLSHKPYTDKYFLRANDILKAEGINPYVIAQIMIRKGPGTVHGIDEAVSILEKYSPITRSGKIFSLNEGAEYAQSETIMIIEAPIQDIIELETMYLGVLSAETTKANDHHGVDLFKVTTQMRAVVDAASRILPSLSYSLTPSCHDIMDVDNLRRMGYTTLMLGDEICQERNSVISALNVLYELVNQI